MTEKAGVGDARFSAAATWGDYDRDGDIDGVESLDNAQWKAYGLGEDSLYLTQ